MIDRDYYDFVVRSEEKLRPWAKHSFETFSDKFLDGGTIFSHYTKLWEDPDRRTRLLNRTPLQIERDRILYSRGMRKLTEKYHVLYSENRRIIRNFTTHSMRMAQVARAIANGLKLNADFAEAIALGAKVGAPPFVHASKSVVSKWIQSRIRDLENNNDADSQRDHRQRTLFPEVEEDFRIPEWIRKIESEKVAQNVKRFMPWAVGDDLDGPYSSGSEGYWCLATNPFLVESRPNRFSPETMFGVWQHNISAKNGPNSFFHSCNMKGASEEKHEIRWDHITYEAIVVRYADDITWAIENLEDANRASVVSGSHVNMYLEVLDSLREKGRVPHLLSEALLERDSGGLYNYFISDFVLSSHEQLEELSDGAHHRQALREGQSEALISLSPEAELQLDGMKSFLEKRIFGEPRVENRFQILQKITDACLNLLYRDRPEALEAHVRSQAKIRNFNEDRTKEALRLLRNPVHKIQMSVDIFSQMSDQEIYDFVGIQGL